MHNPKNIAAFPAREGIETSFLNHQLHGHSWLDAPCLIGD
ncbi:hypothetical protein PRUB_a5220 [Pseudoalteromonas rubra]|uniref:Uncharacterized protein n=2 Tax=Pseudoalteromonas rubra TaxID=43658 RepID=A0A8T0CAM0_9GAMM|nr:hypothetical protein PRUB_a5220 [Pseudoalteromonas rubra]